ncbi:MAG: amidohydrolase family protein [Myxococcota bacterium]
MLHTHAPENAEEIQLIQARYGAGNIEHLHALGFTGPDVILAHGVWVSLKERKILRDTQTRIVHCPSANLKLASGIARVTDLIQDGVPVALGADGAPCNNRLDGFTEMRTVAMLHKVRGGPTAIPAATALRMATLGGAVALGLTDVGRIQEQYKADILLLDLNKPHVFPPTGDLISRIVYSAQSSDVHSLFVDGRRVVQAGNLLVADVAKILTAAKRAATGLVNRVL